MRYYEFELSGKLSDNEFDTLEAAKTAAEEEFVEVINTSYPEARPGEVYEDTARVFMFKGESILTVEDHEVRYEIERTDKEEHFNQGDYI